LKLRKTRNFALSVFVERVRTVPLVLKSYKHLRRLQSCFELNGITAVSYDYHNIDLKNNLLITCVAEHTSMLYCSFFLITLFMSCH